MLLRYATRATSNEAHANGRTQNAARKESPEMWARFQAGRVVVPNRGRKENKEEKNWRTVAKTDAAKRNDAKSNMISLAYILHVANDIAQSMAGCLYRRPFRPGWSS